jgi:hypothetical protein
MNEGKQKFIGGIDFDELKAQRVQLYNAITIDLATARTNEEMVFTGNYIYALEATDVDAALNIRFNELFRAAINVKKGRGVRVPFYRLYITNTAQAGKTLTLAIGIEASDFEIFDVGKALGITGNVNVIPVMRTGNTQVAGSGIANNSTVVLHTVTAGKIFYLNSCSLNVWMTGAGGVLEGYLFVTNAADADQYHLLHLTGYYGTPVESHNDALSFPVPLELPAGWKIKVITSDAVVKAAAFIHGYEV